MVDASSSGWCVYFVRTHSNRLYCGITTNVDRRFKQHSNGTGAKALKGHGPLTLEWHHCAGNNRSIASKIEYQLKQITKAKKEALIQGEIALNDIICAADYAKIYSTI